MVVNLTPEFCILNSLSPNYDSSRTQKSGYLAFLRWLLKALDLVSNEKYLFHR
jgi:hypothetical protein